MGGSAFCFRDQVVVGQDSVQAGCEREVRSVQSGVLATVANRQ